MHDTEKMPAVEAAPSVSPSTARLRRKIAFSPGLSAIVSSIAAVVAVCAVLGCAYLHGEVVALRGELHATRLAARASERAADRASLAAESARTALLAANANGGDTSADTSGDVPAPPDPDR